MNNSIKIVKMPTERQKKALTKLVENRGNVSKAMKDAGYTDASAKNPKNLTESKGWKQLCEEFLPDDLLAKVHREGLEAIRDNKPDFTVRHKYLETAYKVKEKYTDNPDSGNTVNINIAQVPPELLEQYVKHREQQLDVTAGDNAGVVANEHGVVGGGQQGSQRKRGVNHVQRP